MNYKYLKDNPKAKVKFRTLGFITLTIGVICLTIAVVEFIRSFNENSGFPKLFFLGFIGIPLIAIGAMCLRCGYMKEINAYVASETIPVQTEAMNYVLNGTREELAKTISEIKNSSEKKGIQCPKCGRINETDAIFCDNCGSPISKKCPNCGEENDGDSEYCRKCGTKI